MAEMTPEELQSIVSSQIYSATGSLNSDISEHRAELFERYMGEKYGDEAEHKSEVVMSDIADTIEWIMPELMDIFTTSDDTAEFEPVGPEDERAAKQETAVVNHILSQKNERFLVFHQWFKDALLQKNGIVKSYWDERKLSEVEEHGELLIAEYEQVLMRYAEEGAEVEVLEQSWEPGETPEEPLSVKLRVTRTDKRYVVENVPPDEFLITPRHNSIFLDDCPFCAHKPTHMTVSDLIEMGFERDQVESLPDAEEDFEEERTQRFSSQNNTEYSEHDSEDASMREVSIYECYVRADRDGDGVAELLQVYVGGSQNEVMRWADGSDAIEEVSHAPFDALTPILMSHKFYGRSVAELVEDLQRIRTVLIRQMLDNIYNANNVRPHVDETAETENTIDDLLSPEPGRPVRGRGPMAGVSYPAINSMSGEILQAVEYVDHLRENRTGVTKYNQGLDANSLNKTATGLQSILNASQKKILLIARVFAETGVKGLMRRIHRDLRSGPMKEITARIRGEWVTVDPHVWKDRADMSVDVGIGAGDKDMMLARLDAILNRQVQAMEIGLAGPREILHTLHKMVELAGQKAPERFFAPQPQKQQQDPMAGVAQIELGKAQIKAQTDIAKAQINAGVKSQEMDQKERFALMDDDRARDIKIADLAVELLGMQERGVEKMNLADLERLVGQPPTQ